MHANTASAAAATRVTVQQSRVAKLQLASKLQAGWTELADIVNVYGHMNVNAAVHGAKRATHQVFTNANHEADNA